MSAPATPPAASPGSATRKGPRLAVLLSFLGAFLLLIVVFRAVLFPFLMAMFLAYLIEPVVAWAARGKRLGFRWSRGPVIVLMYAVVLTGLFFLVSCGVNRLSSTVVTTVKSLKQELSTTKEKARFVVVDAAGVAKAPSEILVPKGTEIVYDPPSGDRGGAHLAGKPLDDPPAGVYRTWFTARIDSGEDDAEVLLEPTGDPLPPGGEGNRIVRPGEVSLPAGLSLAIEPMPFAKGLEVFFERHVVAPVAGEVERITGSPFDPGFLRRTIAAESEQHGPKVGERIGSWSTGFLIGVGRSLYLVVLILMLTAFIVIDRDRIGRFFASLPPPSARPHYHKLMEYVDRGLAGVIRGQLMICAVNGFLTWLGLWIFKIPYAAPLAFVAGVFSLIPVFGTIASSVPIVLVAIAAGGLNAGLIALGWIGLIHLLEANLFNPLIMGTNAEMHPVIIIFALLAGEHAFGMWGALLAVPTASLIQSCFKFYRYEIEGVPPEEPKLHGKWIRGILAKVAARKKAPPTPTPDGGTAA
jgi:predicted PurR-regulated permease PerM